MKQKKEHLQNPSRIFINAPPNKDDKILNYVFFKFTLRTLKPESRLLTKEPYI